MVGQRVEPKAWIVGLTKPEHRNSQVRWRRAVFDQTITSFRENSRPFAPFADTLFAFLFLSVFIRVHPW